jgi:hypothetical protein
MGGMVLSEAFLVLNFQRKMNILFTPVILEFAEKGI